MHKRIICHVILYVSCLFCDGPMTKYEEAHCYRRSAGICRAK